MRSWLNDFGIGETRSALVDDCEIIEAQVHLDGGLSSGSIVAARLKSVGSGGRNALAVMADGTEILLPRRPAGVSEGATIDVEITREAIAAERWKRPLGRMAQVAEKDSEADQIEAREAWPGELEDLGWDDLVEEAQSGTVLFPGGSLGLFATPAMTLIDVDGSLAPEELAIAGARAAGRAIRRLGIGGSIGIDLPTVQGKAARTAAAEALDAALGDTRFERTAVNGFGFLQVIRPRTHASLLELALDRPAFAARQLLRRAEAGHGAVTLTAAPSVIAVLEGRPEWLDELARRRGGPVGLRAEPTLAIWSGHAQA